MSSITTNIPAELQHRFIHVATWHGSLDDAQQLLAAHPDLATASIFTAAVTGNVEAVGHFVSTDPTSVHAVSEPHGGAALVYLCLSKFLRLQKDREQDFVRAATILLEAGADPNAGFWTTGNHPEFETALYGAAGVAHNAALTRLLLEHGADPNDGEVAYHSPETDDNDALKLLVETGKLTADSLVLMLIRKHDWHDHEGVQYLLQQGADPNRQWGRGVYPLHHALKRSNGSVIIKLLMDHGADPYVMSDGLNTISRAAREGRGDVLTLFSERGISIELAGVERLIAACALGNVSEVQKIIEQSPSLLQELMPVSGDLLARFSLSNNLKGVQLLLSIGVDVNTPYESGDGYFGIPPGSLSIHVAAWLNHPAMVQLLIENGSQVDVPDKNGNTPLALVIRACVDSYWAYRRTPVGARALLEAGASAQNIPYPCGYVEMDELLAKYVS
jgi:ankyrin repeat protein